jgi:hypothetical protein
MQPNMQPATTVQLSYQLMSNVNTRARSSIRSKVCLRMQLLQDATAVAAHPLSTFEQHQNSSPGDDRSW